MREFTSPRARFAAKFHRRSEVEMKRMSLLSCVVVTVGVVTAGCSASSTGSPATNGAGPTVTSTTVPVSSLVLTAADVPAGWTPAAPSSSSSSSSDSTPGCMKGYVNIGGFNGQNSASKASASFEQGSGGAQFEEVLNYASGKAESLVSTVIGVLDGCRTFSTTSADGESATGSITPQANPHLSKQSAAFTVSVTAKSFPITISIPMVIVQVNNDVSLIASQVAMGSTSDSSFHRMLTDAVAKASGKASPDLGANAPKALGQSVELGGSDLKASVTAVRIINPAQAANQYDTPNNGNVYVGVEFKIVNTGGPAFQPSPDSDATLIDTASHSYSSTYADLTGCPSFASSLTLNSGDTADGCVTFQVPTGTTIAKVQFTSQSGGTAEWLAG